ncbi:bacterioferritin [Guyparkeria sp.]|uniref:bacterioferritin n=1 Tax=Guyparkeria sp. TaxID=2035736 RepID=UPI0035624A6B
MCAAKAKKGEKTLKNLQQALSMELTATHQYLLHAHVLEDWGLDRLATKMQGEVQEELGHASKFIDRMLFLDGDPVVSEAKSAKRSKSLADMFNADLKEELASIEFYGQAAAEAGEEGDVGTRHLFEEILMDEEGHADWLKRQLELIERMGEQNFFAAYHTPHTGEE